MVGNKSGNNTKNEPPIKGAPDTQAGDGEPVKTSHLLGLSPVMEGMPHKYASNSAPVTPSFHCTTRLEKSNLFYAKKVFFV